MVRYPRIVRRGNNRIELLFEDARTNDKVRNFAFLANLPVNELLDVRMIGVEHDHFSRAPRRAAGLNRTGGAIEDLEKRHESARRPAAREFFTGRSKFREICSATATAFKNARFADNAVEDAALVNEIVFDAEDVTIVNDEPICDVRFVLVHLQVVYLPIERHVPDIQYFCGHFHPKPHSIGWNRQLALNSEELAKVGTSGCGEAYPIMVPFAVGLRTAHT